MACIEWEGTLNSAGYGVYYDPEVGNYRRAHRRAYAEAHPGQDIRGMFVMHICDNPRCINPDHLRLGTPRDNTHDMLAKRRHWNNRKEFCDHGHEFDEANTYHWKGQRFCRACRAAYQRELRRKRAMR